MALAALEVAGLSFDDVVRALEKAAGQMVTCIDDVKEHHHNIASSGIHMQGYLLTSARLIGLNEVQKQLMAVKETLRRL